MQRANAASGPAHAFTVDVEEYFQVNAFESVMSRDAWNDQPSRLEVGLARLLDLLSAAGAHGTFFTLGWIAERHPALVRRIVDAGHELASHGYWHRRVTTQSPGEFRDDVRRAKDVLEAVAGQRVEGYRAPSFSIIRESEWALDVLAEEGYRYDSSRFPIRRPGYGSPHTPLEPHVVRTAHGELLEIPMTVLRLGSCRLPAAGGGWFRQFPLAITTAALKQRERASASGVFYIHPWELDPGQPRLPVTLLTRIRHYRGMSATPARLATLLQRFRFDSIQSLYATQLRTLARAHVHAR
jgi:polysaccharide deacetylase family protein (PEP-CTERM system associated)